MQPTDEHWLRLVRRRDLCEHRASELWGWIQGIVAARCSTAEAIEQLHQWIERHEELHDEWPAASVRRVLAPAVPAATRARHAEAILAELTRMGPRIDAHDRWRHTRPAAAYDALPGGAVLRARHCVFTGTFTLCERRLAEHATAALGALVRSAAAQRGDYLFVGARASTGWKHSAAGRKIHTVERWRAQGKTACLILTEESWAELLQRCARRTTEPNS